MSKHSDRHHKAYMIHAAEKAEHPIVCAVESVEWIKAAEGETPAADAPKRFKMRAYTGGPMQVGYYGAPVVIDMAGLTAKAPLPILMNHDASQIVGHADEVTAGGATLDLAGIVSGASVHSDQVTASAKLGFPWKASVGARPDKMEFVGEGVSTKVNGKTFTGPLYVARKSTLGEVSFVAMAADSKTNVKVAASAASPKKEIVMKFAEWLLANEFDPATLTEKQTARLQAAYDDEQEPSPVPVPKPEPTPPPATPAEKMRVEAAAESTRIAAIHKVCRNEFPDIQATAISEGWDAIKTELEVVKAERPKPAPPHGSPIDVSTDVIQAAFCRSGGLQNLDKAFKPEVLEAADRMPGFGLQELLLRAAGENGYSGRAKITDGNLREVIRAAFSTHTLTTLLSTAGNKFLLDGFNSIPQTWRKIARIRSLNDFKTHTGFRLTTSLEYEEVPPGGEIKHGSVGQESYTMNVLTFGKMLSFTRQDIINDDLGALDAIREKLGVGAAIKMDNLFWTVFLTASNTGTFWSAAHGNLVTGSALAEAGLNTAVKAFRDMAGPDGNMMNLEPAILLVPSALEPTAKKLYKSAEVRDTTATTKYPTANIYENAFTPIVVPQLGNSSYTGYSATTWYLLANPAVLACAAMCFLNGQESPTIESAEADFNTLGIQFRGFHDFYPVMTEYRPTVKAQA